MKNLWETPARCTPGDPDTSDLARMWDGGWKRAFFPAFWLVYLGETVNGVAQYSHGAGAVAGYVLVAAFALCYLAAVTMGWGGRNRLFWWLYALAFVLTGVETIFAHQDALVFCIYLAVLTVATQARAALSVVVALSVLVGALPKVVPGWTGQVAWNDALSVFLVALAMTAFFKIVQANIALTAARAEVARLAAENERSRIARDLHDLLGHSLTTITVKAGLARRLAERGDTTRSQREITEVEQLSRRTLGDVRAAVAGHREVTLAGEIATAREVMRAAGITAELPGSVDVVDPSLSELFGWVVREGVTNVVRHSRAPQCSISLGERWIEIADNGKGGLPGAGNGLSGLRERLEDAGGTLLANGGFGGFNGFRLRAEVLPPAGEQAPASRVAAQA